MAAPAIDEADEEWMIMALRELVEDDGDQGLEGDLRGMRSMAASLEGAASLTPQSWSWVEHAESMATEAAGILAREAADIQRGLSLVSRRPGEEAFAAALRRQAAVTGAGLADAEWLAAAARRIRVRELRRVAAAEHVAHPDTAAFLGHIARETDASLARGEVPAAEELALAEQAEAAAVRMEQRLAALAGRLRRGAAEFAEVEEEAALVAALERQAGKADAALGAVEAFTASVRRFRAAGGGGGGGGALPVVAGDAGPGNTNIADIYVVVIKFEILHL
ncbi:hypothetical protein HU200_039736 [Digitaria exilis]|uniref:Uncharacterized protein n=1 Tax=Digitaria exilis TaxID=1010633 RepID=A0A835BFJ4_9POAL|nr:hypothetical protein HU200_039732 [Digitaria exilis]KAF8692135.1 hypothetical protein HU200_039736 [Digitaria exilis]